MGAAVLSETADTFPADAAVLSETADTFPAGAAVLSEIFDTFPADAAVLSEISDTFPTGAAVLSGASTGASGTDAPPFPFPDWSNPNHNQKKTSDMSTTEPSKYAENQPLFATERRFPLMGELLADTADRASPPASPPSPPSSRT